MQPVSICILRVFNLNLQFWWVIWTWQIQKNSFPIGQLNNVSQQYDCKSLVSTATVCTNKLTLRYVLKIYVNLNRPIQIKASCLVSVSMLCAITPMQLQLNKYTYVNFEQYHYNTKRVRLYTWFFLMFHQLVVSVTSKTRTNMHTIIRT